MARWVLSHFPPHRTYTEAFGGAASVLLRKPRSYAEVYNDLDEEVVNLFRVLRDEGMAARLRQHIHLTAFSRIEFKAAYELTDEPVERARRLVVRSAMGFGSNAHASQEKGHRSTGFRATSNRSGTTPAIDWTGYPSILPAIVERFRGVVIECRPALDVIAQHDRPDTLHYVDPPYLHETRSRSNAYDLGWRMYAHEMTDADHEAMLARLVDLQGMVVLSGYPAPLYDDALSDWLRVETEARADGARKRTEVLWINPHAKARVEEAQGADLFDWAIRRHLHEQFEG